MLRKSQISPYKIKKILECFAADYSATETAKQLKLNRNTINRYYHIFRKICLLIVTETLSINSDDKTYIGYMKGEYGSQNYLNVYKINEKTFILIKSKEKPDNKNRAIADVDFNKFLGFLYSRLSKFHGFNEIGYYYQLYETSLRHNHTEKELFSILWERLRKKPPPEHMILP